MEANQRDAKTAIGADPTHEEIDELFAQAESISNEIASGSIAELDAPPPRLIAEQFSHEASLTDDPTSDSAFIAENPTPLEAIETMQAQTDELKDLLNDPDPPRPVEPITKPNKPVTAEPEMSPFAGAQLPQPDPGAKPKSKKGSKFNLSSMPKAEPIVAPEKLAAPVQPEPSAAIGTSTSDATANAGSEAKAKPPRKSSAFQRLLGALLRTAKRTMQGGMAIVSGTMVRMLGAIDWPFRSLSPRFKNALGLMGVVTLIMGALAWVLPGMMQSNPFAGMDTGLARKGAAPAAAQGESGHGAPAADHAAPAGGHH